jgi:ATPase subunit of ABC transporter with duplicated ATPase domains
MIHRPIFIKDFALAFSHKTCFEGFNAEVHYGERIGIIGKNGSGKSHLLRKVLDLLDKDSVGYVPQIVEDFGELSGGERLNKALSAALAKGPDLLCLDEPTNHLDRRNRASLMRMLERFPGTLIVVSHDIEVLRRCVQKVWHIAEERVTPYASYDAYQERSHSLRRALESQLSGLQSEKKQVHQDLMRDQERAKKRKLHGEKKYDGDKLALRSAQGRGQRTTNKNRKRIASDKSEVVEALAALRMPEVIKPKFSLSAAQLRSGAPVVSVREGSCGYDEPLLKELHFQLCCDERVLIAGDNGSGKTTFVKSIMGDASVKRWGAWTAPPLQDIGYLDQHYATLNPSLSAIEIIQNAAPHLKLSEIRDHLNAFLLRKNEEVMIPSRSLSGGEKARLSLAQISAKTPRLLILDEVTNNLDLDTREHVIQVLREYPGAMVVISHDVDFAKTIGLMSEFRLV